MIEGLLPKKKQPYLKKQLADGSWQSLSRVARKKSDLKPMFRTNEALQRAFLAGKLPPQSHVGKAVEDCSYTWITFVKKQQLAAEEHVQLTGEDVVKFMLSRAEDFFSNYPHSNTYVLVFDKPQHVPPNKREEQLLRLIGYGAQAEPYDWDPEQEPHILEWTKPIPCHWDSLKVNRAAREQAIRDTVTLIAEHYQPPAGKRLIVDSDAYGDDEEGPLVLATNMMGSQTDCYREPRLHNCIGEGDNCVLFYIKLFSSGGADVDAHRGCSMDRRSWNGSETDDILVNANDTDIWLCLLMSYRQRQKESDFVNRVFVHCGDASISMSSTHQTVTSLSTPSASTTTPSAADDFLAGILHQEPAVMIQGYQAAVRPAERLTAEQQMVSKLREYIDINALFDAAASLHTDPLPPHVIESLFVACIMGGNDYVDGYYGLSYKVLFRTWLKEHQEIGSLVEFVSSSNSEPLISINPASYLSLLMRAYWHAFEKPNITNPNPNNPPKHDTKPNFSQPIHQMSLEQLRTLVARLRKKKTDHVPSNAEIATRMLRTQWYLRYCYWSHEPQPLQHIPSPQRSGWELSTVKYRTKLGHKKTLTMMTRRLS